MQPPIPLEIRELPPEEFESVWPIVRAVLEAGDTYALDGSTTLEQARDFWTQPPVRAFVARLDGRVVGTSAIRPAQAGRGSHVANAGYMVAPEARGQGIARQLCEHSLEVAREMGFLAMQFSYVVSTNETAVRVWERCGFKVVGRVPAAFRHEQLGLVDILIMHRFL
jgi:GNAT superfamily N-acetyltransferase